LPGLKPASGAAERSKIPRSFFLGGKPRVIRYLACRFGDEPEQVVIWDTVEITVGRSKSQDIGVVDAEVSREHAAFRKVGDRYTVEDLGTGLGTLVNGERIKSHHLQVGDAVQIGSLAITFGETDRRIRPGGEVRYASELKVFGPRSGPRGGGGRTMLAFEAAEELASPSVPPPETSGGAKAVTADGILEDLAGADPLGSEDDEEYLGPLPRVRDLDRELEEDPSMGPTQTVVRLEVELEGPRAALRALLSAVEDKSIEVPPIRIHVRRLRGD
jgi:predicted component of type VI protein secretion system